MDILLIGLALASMTMTISKAHIMRRVRCTVAKLGPWAENLINCPYCLSHWFAFIIVGYKFGFFPLDRFLIMSFGIITITSVASLIIILFFLALDKLDEG